MRLTKPKKPMKLLSMLHSFVGATLFFLLFSCSTSSREWGEKNNALILKHGLTVRELVGVPVATVESNLREGQVTAMSSLGDLEFYPGVSGRLLWGNGVMVAEQLLAPNVKIPEQTLDSDVFVFVLEGEASVQVDGRSSSLVSKKREAPTGIHNGTPRIDFLYLEKGSKYALEAGSSGAKLYEVSSPIRLDYLQIAGLEDLPSTIADIYNPLSANIEPNKVYDLYDILLTELAPGAYTRLLSGRNMLLSFISMDPGAEFGHHIHPEEQIMLIQRGSCEEILLDGIQPMKTEDLVRIPGNYVHGSKIGEQGVDALDIFWPSRPDYMAREKEAKERFREFIPTDAKLELVVDGKKTIPELFFAEGPKWMNGKLYFSNMYFDQDYNGDPKRSSTVVMNPDGSYRNITEGKMQTNGLYPYKNGNLIVCDMMGHQVVEMTPSGQVLRVLADRYDGKPIDGPNDIVTDTKGGFYFTDPQFTMEAEKFQPGRAVYYVSPKGEITRVTDPNEFAMPNGILLSPDGKTLYINNCFDKEDWYPVKSEKDNYIWAYDVNEDGSISNGRQFVKVHLTEDVLDRKGRSSGADGMAIDKEGNIYVATYYGVQIFDNSGKFVGMINMPSFPVSLAFGDDDMKTLYIVSYSKVFKIRTNKVGYVNYL